MCHRIGGAASPPNRSVKPGAMNDMRKLPSIAVAYLSRGSTSNLGSSELPQPPDQPTNGTTSLLPHSPVARLRRHATSHLG